MPKLAIVETPLQLLCAYEAVGDSQDNRIILRLTGIGRNDEQTLELARQLNLECEIVNAPVGHPLALASVLWKMRGHMIRRYTAVYLGSYFCRFIRAAATFFRGPVYVLDDGVATLLAQEKMRQSGRPISIYTFLPVEPLPGQICVRHSFARLRSLFYVPSSLSRGTYFIGQPLVEKRLVTAEAYDSLLRTAVEKAGGGLEYYSHRTECEAALRRISLIPGVTVKHADLPVELEFLLANPRPEVVFSCISTALFSVSSLLPECRVEAMPFSDFYRNEQIPHAFAIVQAMRATNKIHVAEI